jgi:hypothetical protein
MQQPNPWILFAGGSSLFYIAAMIGGLHAPAWARYGGMGLCIALGFLGMGLGLARFFKKRPARPAPRRTRGARRQAGAPNPPAGAL